MTEIQAIKIDQILNYLIIPRYEKQFPITYIGDIYKLTSLHNDEINDLLDIINKISFEESPIAQVDTIYNPQIGDTRIINATYNTEKFLKVGGCIEHYRNLIEEQRKQNELKELEKQKLLNDLASFRITKKQYIWNKLFAIAGFILGLISCLWQIFKHT